MFPHPQYVIPLISSLPVSRRNNEGDFSNSDTSGAFVAVKPPLVAFGSRIASAFMSVGAGMFFAFDLSIHGVCLDNVPLPSFAFESSAFFNSSAFFDFSASEAFVESFAKIEFAFKFAFPVKRELCLIFGGKN